MLIAFLRFVVNLIRSPPLPYNTSLSFHLYQSPAVFILVELGPYCLSVGSTSSKAPVTTTSCAVLPLLKNPKMLFLFPSGLVPGAALMLDQTLDRRLEPSAFVLTGYMTSEGLRIFPAPPIP